MQVGDDPRATEALREMDDDLAKEYGIRVSISVSFIALVLSHNPARTSWTRRHTMAAH